MARFLRLIHLHEWRAVKREPNRVLEVGSWLRVEFRGKLLQRCTECGEERKID